MSSTFGVQVLVDRQEIQSIAINRLTEHFQIPLYARIPTNRVSGTGWLIEPTLLVTNHHVIAGAVRLGVRLENGDIIPAQIEARCPDLDLALLRLEKPIEQDPMRIELDAMLGQSFDFGGFSASGSWQEKSGVLISKQEIQALTDERQTFFVLDQPSDLGFSGGPVWNEQGQVIGMMTATDGKRSFVLPAATIVTYIQERECHWASLGIQMNGQQVVAINQRGPSKDVLLGEVSVFQQKKVEDGDFLRALMRRLQAGEVVQMTIAGESFFIQAQPIENWSSEQGTCRWRGATLESTSEGWKVYTLEHSSVLFQMGVLPDDVLLLSESCAELSADDGLRIIELRRNDLVFHSILPFGYQE